MTDISDAVETAGEIVADSAGLEGQEPDSNHVEFETDNPAGDGSESDSSDYLFEVDGKKITLDEARNGWLRQSDYTKKTQELAEMRSRLAEAEAITAALQQDPVGTLKALQDAFGVSLGESQDDPYADMDPEAARIAVLEQKIAAQEQAASQAAIEAELQGLHQLR